GRSDQPFFDGTHGPRSRLTTTCRGRGQRRDGHDRERAATARDSRGPVLGKHDLDLVDGLAEVHTVVGMEAFGAPQHGGRQVNCVRRTKPVLPRITPASCAVSWSRSLRSRAPRMPTSLRYSVAFMRAVALANTPLRRMTDPTHEVAASAGSAPGPDQSIGLPRAASMRALSSRACRTT